MKNQKKKTKFCGSDHTNIVSKLPESAKLYYLHFADEIEVRRLRYTRSYSWKVLSQGCDLGLCSILLLGSVEFFRECSEFLKGSSTQPPFFPF